MQSVQYLAYLGVYSVWIYLDYHGAVTQIGQHTKVLKYLPCISLVSYNPDEDTFHSKQHLKNLLRLPENRNGR